MRILATATLLASLSMTPIFACSEDGKGGFLPENDMNIPVDAKVRNDMTEERFNEIIDEVEAVFAPIVKKKRAKLKFNRKWDDGTVNASAQRFFRTWVVNMYGGLARHEVVTDDGFAMVVCHELGHHMAGAPKVKIPMNTWASNEGQSDYWGAMKCFKEVYKNDDNVRLIAEMNVDPLARKNCEAVYTNEGEQALCMRTAMAGLSLAKLLGGGNRNISFKTPDRSAVDRTNDRHPAAQCRLDTYFHGGLCDMDLTTPVSKRDPNKGVCIRKDGVKLGVRPLCWYKPRS